MEDVKTISTKIDQFEDRCVVSHIYREPLTGLRTTAFYQCVNRRDAEILEYALSLLERES